MDFITRFGFHTTPFTCEIRVEERYANDVFEDTLKQLTRVIEKRMSGVLIGSAGTGKTALLRALIARLPETRYRIHYVKVTDLAKQDMCREIAAVTGIESCGNYPGIVRRLQEQFASSLENNGIRPVLIMDEAHGMRPDVLGMLRILTNFDMDSRLVVSIILAGQANLSKLLRRPGLEDLSHRMALCTTLRLMSRKEIVEYVKHRCHITGVSTVPFDTSAMEALYEIGRGNFRATDYLALKALEAAHDRDCDVVDSNHVVEARKLLWP